MHSYCPDHTNFDLVIDHHKEIPNGGFNGLFLNLKAGSCCATIYQLIKAHDLQFEEDNDADSKVATGLLVGIITDTEYQTSDDTTDLEHEAYRDLFEFRNSAALKQITRYKQPREWVQARACVAQKAHDRIKDGVLIHGIGFITGNNRDLIAAVADEMLSWENVETSVAFAVVDGDRIEGSVRSSNAALAVPGLCKDLGGKHGSGGGKLGKGAYQYGLGSCTTMARWTKVPKINFGNSLTRGNSNGSRKSSRSSRSPMSSRYSRRKAGIRDQRRYWNLLTLSKVSPSLRKAGMLHRYTIQ